MSNSIHTSLEELHALADLIKSSVVSIEKACLESKQPFPSPDLPFNPQLEGIRMSPEVQQAGDILVSAASQLVAAVRPPPMTVMIYSLQFHLSACMRVAVDNHVVEILRDAGAQGLHVRDIAAPTRISPEKLARVLRTLATHHVFREVSPDTFANNATSSALDTGKTMDSLLADPLAKYDNTSGIAALVGHCGDECMKSTAYLQETLADPSWTNSGDPAKTAMQKAFDTDLPYWEWAETPENALRLRRFGNAMTGLTNATPPRAILEGFDWSGLPRDSVVVDVGGGVGSQTAVLAKAFEHIKFVVQDRSAVIQNSAPGYWKEKYPEAIPSGRVVLQSHDFFSPQPVHGPAVFMMRCILHDWSDDYCVKILRHLRDAADPKTQLVIVDSIVSYACPVPEQTYHIPGVTMDSFPSPLLPNHGAANALPYLSDMQMMNMLNATERTVEQFEKLFAKGGWKLARVHLVGGLISQGSKLIGVPA